MARLTNLKRFVIGNVPKRQFLLYISMYKKVKQAAATFLIQFSANENKCSKQTKQTEVLCPFDYYS